MPIRSDTLSAMDAYKSRRDEILNRKLILECNKCERVEKISHHQCNLARLNFKHRLYVDLRHLVNEYLETEVYPLYEIFNRGKFCDCVFNDEDDEKPIDKTICPCLSLTDDCENDNQEDCEKIHRKCVQTCHECPHGEIECCTTYKSNRKDIVKRLHTVLKNILYFFTDTEPELTGRTYRGALDDYVEIMCGCNDFLKNRVILEIYKDLLKDNVDIKYNEENDGSLFFYVDIIE